MSEAHRHRDLMIATLTRLFESEAALRPSDGAAPMMGLECQLQFKSGARAGGMLTPYTSPDAPDHKLLRMITPATLPDAKEPNNARKAREVTIESFFDYEDIELIAVVRENAPKSKLHST